MAVEIVQLCKIEAGRCPADSIEVEPGDRLLGRYDLLVAVAPAEAEQIIAQRLGQIAELTIGVHAQSAVPLGQLGTVRPVDQWHVGEIRYRPA